MNKPYLLIAGDYYPSGDTGDWIGCFSTYEEAKEQESLWSQVPANLITIMLNAEKKKRGSWNALGMKLLT
jgi:hypothetical protein